MGCAGAKRLHGGRFAGPRHSRERHLSGERSHGIFGPRGEGRSEGAEAGGRSARGGGGGDAERREFSERDTRAAAAKILRYFCVDNHRYNNYCGVVSKARKQRTALPVEDQTCIALLKAADTLAQEAEQLLKANGLTGAQYNVLRILRGAEPQGLACRTIGERMISHDPDMTRLLDRMEKRSLITRRRQSDDRRVVKTRITSGGLGILQRLEPPIPELPKQHIPPLPPAPAKNPPHLPVRHLTISNVRGAFTKVSGTVQLDDKDIAKSSVDVTIDAASVDTRVPDRDNDLRSDHFFDVAKYPTITFKSKKVEQVGAGKLRITGDLTIHRTTKEVVLDVDTPTPPVKDPWGNQRAAAMATTKINRQDFGVKWNATMDNGGGVVVGDGTVSRAYDL